MPCDTVQITTLDVSKMHPDLLRKALESMGYTVDTFGNRLVAYGHGSTVQVMDGRATMTQGRAADELQANLQRAYSREVVSESAKRAGFVVTKKADYRLELNKRY